MLAPSSAQAPYPSPRRKRQVSSIPLRLLSKSQSRCWITILCFLRTLAQRWLFPLRRTHTRCRGKKPHTVETRGSRRRTVPAVEGCKDANCSRCYPLALLLRQAPEPLVGAALRKNAEISLCDFQRPLRNAELLCKRKDFLGWSWLRQKPARLVFHLHGLCLHLPCAV